MSRRSNPYKDVDSDGSYRDGFASLYWSMATSKVYMELSDSAKTLLMCCKLCRRFNKTDFGFEDDGLTFYFNRELQKRFGLNNPNKVYRSMRELVTNGFIEVVQTGSNTRTKNTYRFSKQWIRKEKGQDVTLSNQSKAFLKGRG